MRVAAWREIITTKKNENNAKMTSKRIMMMGGLRWCAGLAPCTRDNSSAPTRAPRRPPLDKMNNERVAANANSDNKATMMHDKHE